MTGADILVVAVILVLIGLSGLLSGAEAGLSRMNRLRAVALAEEGHKSGPALVELVGRPEEWRNVVLLVVLAAQLVQAALTGVLAERLFGPVGIVVAIAVNVVVVFVLAVAAPRTWAIEHTDVAALRAARPVRALARVWPLRILARGLIGLTNVLLPGRGLKQGPFVSEDELLALAEAAAQEQVIEAEERELIHSVIEFGDTVAREVMVPRTDMVVAEAADTVAHTLDAMLGRGFSRVPVVDDGIDDVVGIAYAKDLMRDERRGEGADAVRDKVRPARFVPESKPVADLMREMQAAKVHLAIVVDEYGGTAGLVTFEDLLEELIGEITDEFDPEERRPQQVGEGEWLVDGRIPIDEAAELVDVALPDDDWDTVAGFLLHLLGRFPAAGESVQWEELSFTVEAMDGKRIGAVRIERSAPPSTAAAG